MASRTTKIELINRAVFAIASEAEQCISNLNNKISYGFISEMRLAATAAVEPALSIINQATQLELAVAKKFLLRPNY